MKRYLTLSTILLTFLCLTTSLKANVRETVEIKPVFMNINKFEKGHKVDSYKVFGAGVQAYVYPIENSNCRFMGKYIKCFGKRADFEEFALNMGYDLPVNELIYATPYFGISQNVLKEDMNINCFHYILRNVPFKSKFITFDIGTEIGYMISDQFITKLDFSISAGRKTVNVNILPDMKDIIESNNKSVIGKSDISLSLSYIYSDKINFNAKIGHNVFLARKKYGFNSMYAAVSAEFNL